MIKNLKLIPIASACLLMGGCASTQYEAIQKSSDKVTDLAQQALAAGNTPVVANPIAVESDRIWVPKTALKFKDDGLPDLFKQPMGVSFKPKSSLREATELLARNAGIRFSFAPDVVQEADKAILTADYQNISTLSGFLDTLTSLPNPAMSWQYKDGQVEIFRYITRTIPVRVPTLETTFSANMNNTNTSGGSGGGAGGAGGSSSSTGTSVKMESKLNHWESIEKEVNQMLTPGIGKAVVSRPNQQVVITDFPQAVNAIEAHIKRLNETTLRRVFVKVQIMTIKNTTSADQALNWSSIIEKLGNQYGLALSAKSPTLPAGFTDGAGTINAVFQAKGMADPTTALVSILNKLGMSTSVATYPVWARSGVPTHTNVNKDTGYVAQVTSTQPVVPGGQPTQSLTGGTVTAGVSLHTLVQVLDSSSISIEENIDISTLDALKSMGNANSGQIQLPEQSRVSLAPMTTLQTGETLVIGGFEQHESIFTQSSMGDASNSFMVGSTGSRMGNSTKSKVVVLITPFLM